jgi:glutamate--cysteine ligase
MHFAPLAFDAPCSSPDPEDPDCPPNRFYAYGVVARLALLAAAIELERAEREFERETHPPLRAANS